MNQTLEIHKSMRAFIIFGITLSVSLSLLTPALADYPLLKKNIITYNINVLKKSLVDDTYRGEAGILRIRPEVAKSLGLKVFIDQDYLDSKHLLKEADKSLEKAKDAMSSKDKERYSGYYSQKIAEHFLLFKKSSESAKKKLMAYQSRLNPGVDERFSNAISSRVMDRLLEKSLRKTDNRLRDALAYFYNICQEKDYKSILLTTENVRFVNHVFNGFLAQASEQAIKIFDLDRDHEYKNRGSYHDWKKVAREEISPFVNLLESALKSHGNTIYDIDPLLFIALMRKESNFDPLAISHMGAAGLTQIMPRTAKGMGMKKIHLPSYFDDAVSLLKKERKTRSEAMAALFQISAEDRLLHAKRARQLMQSSLVLGKKRERLFARYRKELLEKRTDDRLQPATAIEYGLKYFAMMMKNQRGDISLALASYNAGPHRIKEFKGIPPYEETVNFRNRILEFYREYIRKVEHGLLKSSKKK